MLTYDDLFREIKRRPKQEQLFLVEEIIRSLREAAADTEVEADQEDSADEDEEYDETFVPRTTPEAIALGWPPNYFEETYGSLRGVHFDVPD